MNRTNIEWTNYTWNPCTGCTRGCSYCYARRMAHRLAGRAGYPKENPFAPTFHPDKLLEPLALKKPSKIFTCSMGELFDPQAKEFWLDLLVVIMRECPQHTFQILTKRPDRIPRVETAEAYWPSNLWLGVSVDGKTNGMNLVSDLFDSEFPFTRFVSFEPLLGPIQDLELLDCVQWIIIGAQTGPGATQPKREWYEPIVKEAIDTNIPLFVKNNLQWAQWPKIWGFPRPHEFPEAVH